MNNNQMENIEKFEQYLEEILDENQRKDFERELGKDADLKQEFNQHKIVVDGIKLHGRKALLKDLKSWDAEMKGIELEPEDSNRTIGYFKWYYAAAAIAIILVSVVVLYSTLDTGYDNIVAVHYQPYNYISEIQRGEPSRENAFEKIYQYYDRGEYRQVIEMINEFPESERSELMNYIQANSYQALEDYNMAIPIFENIMDEHSVYSPGAKWYLSLCYLSVNEKGKAIALLNELKDTKSSFAPKAEKLLDDLN